MPIGYPLATGATIAAYTVVDGIGVRMSGSPVGYIGWLFALFAIPIVLVAIVSRRAEAIVFLRARWRAAGLAALFNFGSYGLAIFALSLGAMAHVSALRETSVIIAALIGAGRAQGTVRTCSIGRGGPGRLRGGHDPPGWLMRGRAEAPGDPMPNAIPSPARRADTSVLAPSHGAGRMTNARYHGSGPASSPCALAGMLFTQTSAADEPGDGTGARDRDRGGDRHQRKLRRPLHVA